MESDGKNSKKYAGLNTTFGFSPQNGIYSTTGLEMTGFGGGEQTGVWIAPSSFSTTTGFGSSKLYAWLSIIVDTGSNGSDILIYILCYKNINI